MTPTPHTYLPANKLVAVVEITQAQQAVSLCQALIAGGVTAIEVTLRTPQALQAVQLAVDAKLPISIGVGTILNVDHLQAAQDAGAQFFVSPAATARMLERFSHHLGVNAYQMIPGVATASEALLAYEAGFEVLKFFPAQASGGVEWLKGVAGPMPHIKFMPTGGVREATLKEYASIPTVAAVGGTWIAPAVDIAQGNWAAITARAQAACALLAS